MHEATIDPKALSLLKDYQNPKEIFFGKTFVPAMIECSFQDGSWEPLKLIPYQKILIDPAAKVLHYAQEIFEGLKCYKNPDGQSFLFRPYENAKRFNHSAKKMGMPSLPEEVFVKSLEVLAGHSSHSFQTEIGDSFYLRPFMFGDEAQLGVRPSCSYKYYLIGGPAGNYFTKSSVRVRVEDNAHRASAHGIGSAKTGGNYAASMEASLKTKKMGYDQTLWLDPVSTQSIEELSGMNFFAIIDNILVTPKKSDSILHGITRDSLLKLASSWGHKTEERDISILKLLSQIEQGKCTEAFASGTAAVLTPIESLYYKNKEYRFLKPHGEMSLKLKSELLKIQSGRTSDSFGWVHPIDNRT